MKIFTKYIAIIVLMLFGMTGFNVAFAEIVKVEFNVANMKNLTDQYKVRKILWSLEGIKKAILLEDDEIVLLNFDDEFSSLFDIKTAMAAQGYPTSNIKILKN